MADLLIAISMMFAGAALALGGFALGQSVERRRWLQWTRPKKPGFTTSLCIEEGTGPAAFIKFPKGWGRRDA